MTLGEILATKTSDKTVLVNLVLEYAAQLCERGADVGNLHGYQNQRDAYQSACHDNAHVIREAKA